MEKQQNYGAPTPESFQNTENIETESSKESKTQRRILPEAHPEHLWERHPRLYKELKNAPDLESARTSLYSLLDEVEKSLLWGKHRLHSLELDIARQCIKVMRNILSPLYEEKTGESSLDYLWKLARGDEKIHYGEDVGGAFVLEFVHLFNGIRGESGIYPSTEDGDKILPEFLKLKGREAALSRTNALDSMTKDINLILERYPSGLDDDIIEIREQNRLRIMNYFNASEEDWNNYIWQTRHVIRNHETVFDLIELSPDKRESVQIASEYHIPFGITPYYLSLMDPSLDVEYDHAVRAQVIPPLPYMQSMAEHRADRSLVFDFMGEHDTSPVKLVTRRYPGIAIIKPYNTCAQICVYCQRNWEIDQVLDPRAEASGDALDKALKWFELHPSVEDVLITGGDPLIMPDAAMDHLMSRVAEIPHVRRIRLGTRTPVVLPMRWTDELMEILVKYHVPGEREIAIVTHFEHSAEITPQVMEATMRIRNSGIGLYNQQVFTMENSRRFETYKLRKDLRSIGVDPYYNFNMKGKGETRNYMVPVARILQERKEEARLLPGLDRTDEPVFNVPKMGKNHLRAGQDHQIVMIKPDGSRIYEFHPWEKYIDLAPPYYYSDIPIQDYLEHLKDRGEDVDDYHTIWYYF